MFWNAEKTVIQVRFWESGAGEPFASSQLPIEQLPDTFAIHTDLEMSSGKYVVVKAEPSRKEDFKKTGILDLYLQRVEAMDPSQILFSLPTIEDAVPSSNDHPLSGQAFSIHEDEWRQLEFVSRSFAAQVEAECEQIRAVRAQATNGPGFNRIHVRRAIAHPLQDTSLQLESLLATVGEIQHRYSGFTTSEGQMVTDSFAVKLASGVHLFGATESDGTVTALCLADCTAQEHWMSALCQAQGLILVQWVHAQLVVG